MSQIGNLPQIGVNIKNIWNHHLARICSGNAAFSCDSWVVYRQSFQDPHPAPLAPLSRSTNGYLFLAALSCYLTTLQGIQSSFRNSQKYSKQYATKTTLPVLLEHACPTHTHSHGILDSIAPESPPKQTHPRQNLRLRPPQDSLKINSFANPKQESISNHLPLKKLVCQETRIRGAWPGDGRCWPTQLPEGKLYTSKR